MSHTPTSMSHPPTQVLFPAPSDMSATVFPSHVRASFRRDPTDRTGELVRLLDDIATVTHSVSKYVAARHHSARPTPDADYSPHPSGPRPHVATQKLYNSLCHDGYACIILEKDREAPLTFPESAVQGGYVLMLSSLDIDQTATDNVTCGTIFSVYKRKSSTSLPGRLKDLQQQVDHQVAAGFVLYSSATTLYYTMHAGVYKFYLQPVATQYFLQPNHPIAFDKPSFDLYTDYHQSRTDPALGKHALAFCSARSGKVYDNGCMIANFQGAMAAACLFIGHNMHLLCEAAPLALIVEQMGGKATDGAGNRILDMGVDDEDVHKRVSFCAGPTELVDSVETTARKA
ncbi:unnamed protein product [Chondrus crispus]|uniref:Fructose-bisphosphatase n=1 Tax=Chondrus crispus TaxID=2769 RepID=R7Q6L2_CHOCR|nr:unnamed protein product [Chondrus crispus]CDF33468.1 unnamed protein product [Chondrus crispus]|eukprot:XP_005713271.1 unnamed protein product [Chondrus crispus]